MARVLVLSLSDVARDPRVARQVGFLRDSHDVVVAAHGPPSATGVEFVHLPAAAPMGVRRAATRAAAHATLRPFRRFHRLYWSDPRFRDWRDRLAGTRADVVVANDAIALPIAFSVAAGAPVVFDAHEYAPTEHEELLRWRLLIRPLVRYICRAFLPRVAAMTAVSPGIGALYRRDTGIEPVVVTNAAPFAELPVRPVGDPVRVIHFGGADRLRRIEWTIEAMRLLPDGYVLDLLLVGNERYVGELRALAAGDPRIRFLDPVPPAELVPLANAYDVGVFMQPGGNPQRTYALPNKFFEYLQARLAVAIGPAPDMAAIIERYACGIVARETDPAALADAIRGTSRERLQQLKQGADRAARELNAEANGPLVLEVVRRALQR